MCVLICKQHILTFFLITTPLYRMCIFSIETYLALANHFLASPYSQTNTIKIVYSMFHLLLNGWRYFANPILLIVFWFVYVSIQRPQTYLFLFGNSLHSFFLFSFPKKLLYHISCYRALNKLNFSQIYNLHSFNGKTEVNHVKHVRCKTVK